MQGSGLGETFDLFPLPITHMGHISTAKLRQQGDSFLIYWLLICLWEATKLCGVFSNKVNLKLMVDTTVTTMIYILNLSFPHLDQEMLCLALRFFI